MKHREEIARLTVLVGLVLAARSVQADAGADVAAVSYAIPAEAPAGDVQILSLGAAELPTPSLVGTRRFLHLRLAASNRDDRQTWILDARDQLLRLSEGTTLSPRFAESSGGGRPARLVLRAGERGYLDLFFRLDEMDPFWTSLTWMVRRGAGAILATTAFERVPTSLAHADYGHYRPSYYAGGSLYLGALWCSPHWGAGGWHHHYRHYRRFRYSGRSRGYDVVAGQTRWKYERERPGSAWRGHRPVGGATAIAPPVPGGGDGPDPGQEPTPWRLQVERVLPSPQRPASASLPAPVDRSFRDTSSSDDLSAARPSFDPSLSSSSRSPEPSSSPPMSDSVRSAVSASPSISSFSSSSSSSSSSSASDSSSSSSPSSSSPSGPSSSSSSSSGDSVGSRWRSR